VLNKNIHGDSKVFLPLLLSIAIVVLIFLFNYIYSYYQQPEIKLEVWTSDIVYAEDVNLSTPKSCDGRFASITYYANATLNGEEVKDANFILRVYHSDSTKYSNSSIDLEFDAISQIWKKSIIYGCIPLGSYYGKIDVSIIKEDKVISASAMTKEFQVKK
jgi:hypothetical protein